MHDLCMDRLEQLLSVQDLADYLGVPVATVYAWRHRRLGPPGFRVGKHVRYRRRDVEDWVKSRVNDSRDAVGDPTFSKAARDRRNGPSGADR